MELHPVVEWVGLYNVLSYLSQLQKANLKLKPDISLDMNMMCHMLAI